ncbi:MAG: methyltransferase domain-containing protein [Bacteroides sp.]|nr:methyltransferase domain-containing protein [Bacteroides sp.]
MRTNKKAVTAALVCGIGIGAIALYHLAKKKDSITSEEYKKLSLKEFDQAAAKFDDNDPSVYNMCRKDYPDVLAETISEPFNDLLDAGCGTGAMLSLFKSDYPEKNYTGIDLSEKMIETAKKKRLDGVNFVAGDCENLPFADGSFDVVTCSMSFHHYPNPEKFFMSLHRVLRPGGRLILRDMASSSGLLMWFFNCVEIPVVNRVLRKGDVHVYTKADIQRLCDLSGMTLERYEVRKGFRLHCVVRNAESDNVKIPPDKTLKKLRPAMVNFLRSRYPENEVERRWSKVVKLYNKWLSEEGDLGGNVNMMSSNITLCYAVCAFYEALDRRLTAEDFDVLLNEAISEKFALMNKFDFNKFYNKKPLIKLVYSFLEKYKKQVDKRRGNVWGNTWKVRINPDDHMNGIAFTLDTCPLYEFAQKHGYMDVLPLLCTSDQVVAKQFHAKLIRHSTLSDGDGKCEYWYVGDKSPEALNDKGSK